MFTDLLKVEIDFDRSHLVFPGIIETMLLVLGVVILIQRRAAILASLRGFAASLPPARWNFDRTRLFGTLALTVIYFAAMEPVGHIWANTGMGFLICSMLFCLGLSRLLAHDITRRKWINILLMSVIGPTLVWLVFSQVFRVTLP